MIKRPGTERTRRYYDEEGGIHRTAILSITIYSVSRKTAQSASNSAG